MGSALCEWWDWTVTERSGGAGTGPAPASPRTALHTENDGKSFERHNFLINPEMKFQSQKNVNALCGLNLVFIIYFY